MRKSNQAVHSIKPLVRSNKNFVYKEKKYPFDFELIIKNSNYFYRNRDDFLLITDIEIPSSVFNLTESSIHAFISCCENLSFEINKSDIFSLHQLAIKYEVPELLKITTEYINQNNNNLIFESILFKIQSQNQDDQNQFKNSIQKEEKYISSHFFELVNNERMLDLPISVLYRILNDYDLSINQANPTNQSKIIDFLFKCLDKFRRKASILFLNLDLENQRIDLFNRLKTDYSDIFDFTMLNPKYLLKTTSDLLSEVTKLKSDLEMKEKEMNDLIMTQKKLIESGKKNEQKLMESIQNFVRSEINKEHQAWNKSFNELKENVQVNNDEFYDKLKKLKNELDNSIDLKISNQNKKLSESIGQLDSKCNSKINSLLKKQNNDQSNITLDILILVLSNFFGEFNLIFNIDCL